MKKNKMMRLASAMMVMTLMTTSVISGTFAKYVTKADATDSARVAKWGVEVTAEGSELFSEIYEAGNETVDSFIDDDVVAPGTKNDKGVKFTLKGQPEVDVNVSITVDDVKDVFLKAGTYANMVTGNDEKDTFTFAEDYYPVVFTLTNGTGAELKQGHLSDIKSYLEGLSGNYDANKNLAEVGTGTDGEYVLTWAWDFPTTANDETDMKDTLLGNLAADSSQQVKWNTNRFYPVAANYDYCNNVSFKVSITVTQID